MKTKVLVVPTLIVISGYVALAQIKPSFDQYQAKRTERNDAENRALEAESIAKNVGALKSEIDTKKDTIVFIQNYLPKEKDEARIFDAMNFITGQAGLVTSSIQLKPLSSSDQELANQTFAVGDEDENFFDDSEDGTGVIPYKAPVVEKYALTLEALGGYTNIKDLVKKLEAFDRLQQIQGFKISIGEGQDSEAISDTLTFTYDAVLPFQREPAPINGEALTGVPGLQSGSLELTQIESIRSKNNSVVPNTILGTDGKANPFE